MRNPLRSKLFTSPVGKVLFLGILLFIIGFAVPPFSQHLKRSEVHAQTPPSGECGLPYHQIHWPSAENPIWSLCWISPEHSSGILGSGIELRDVYYKGRPVLKRAHMPILNVIYSSWEKELDGCGPTYRDWLNDLSPFEADNQIAPGYAEPTLTPKTVCDHPGVDAGNFKGVAVEKKPDQLILTSQMSAGWYRYPQKWIFYADGTIQAPFGFTSVEDSCVPKRHRHHAYYRFDFDIDGGDNNEMIKQDKNRQETLLRESSMNSVIGTIIDKVTGAKRKVAMRTWVVRDPSTGRGFELIPGTEDAVPPDNWAPTDFWALLYKDDEIDDFGALINDNDNERQWEAAHLDDFLTKEGIKRKDVVLWYHAGFAHTKGDKEGEACRMLGPTLKPVGAW